MLVRQIEVTRLKVREEGGRGYDAVEYLTQVPSLEMSGQTVYVDGTRQWRIITPYGPVNVNVEEDTRFVSADGRVFVRA